MTFLVTLKGKQYRMNRHGCVSDPNATNIWDAVMSITHEERVAVEMLILSHGYQRDWQSGGKADYKGGGRVVLSDVVSA
jgi:hypothetical protein